MSHHHHPPPSLAIFLLFSLLPALDYALPVLLNPTQSFNPNPSRPITIPSFPEQSALAGCPVHLPDELFPAVKAHCTAHSGQQLSRSKCCPVLAAWLYSAYSDTALGTGSTEYKTTSYEMPLLPDDSETCVDGLENMMRAKGLNLVKPNQTCNAVYCYCGIRLHPLTCPQAFRVSEQGKLVGDKRVSVLERDCLSSSAHNGTRNRLAHCSKCLHSLYSLKKNGIGISNATEAEDRTRKMRGRDCELMGLTWLLNKNRDAYMPTVTAVMRARMQNSDDSDPQSCSLSSDGLPLAVDSAEINDQSSSVTLQYSPYLYLSSLVLLSMYPNVLSYYF